jgi:hypothetical protein
LTKNSKRRLTPTIVITGGLRIPVALILKKLQEHCL